MAIHVLENYVTVEEYARLCGVKRRTVMDRIKSELISAIKVDGYYAINTVNNPPREYIHRSWKKPGGGAHVSHSDWRCVVSWCNGKKMRCYPFLRAIITGNMEGLIIGDEVFARLEDLERFRKNRL